VLTADPGFGQRVLRLGLCAVPDENALPATLARLETIALEPEEHETPPRRAA
jgi:hypothetical protein